MKLIFFTLLSALLIYNFAGAAEGSHDHSKEASKEAATLKLDNGQKWKTDASLRQGMDKIRDLIQTNMLAIHKGKLTDEQYKKLGTATDEQIQFIFKNCKLSPQADAQIHLVLAQMMRGQQKMKDGPTPKDRQEGAIEVMGALENYPKYFDHPDWKGLDHSK